MFVFNPSISTSESAERVFESSLSQSASPDAQGIETISFAIIESKFVVTTSPFSMAWSIRSPAPRGGFHARIFPALGFKRHPGGCDSGSGS